MFNRNGKAKRGNPKSVRVHVSSRGELRVNANEVFAKQHVKELLDQVSEIKTKHAVRFPSQSESESDSLDD
ncbi:MAG: hypothetical protein OXG36_06940 [Caldilineaceae bacterium]|nr:hypothetical protein [Caldilineaceae bacterium]